MKLAASLVLLVALAWGGVTSLGGLIGLWPFVNWYLRYRSGKKAACSIELHPQKIEEHKQSPE